MFGTLTVHLMRVKESATLLLKEETFSRDSRDQFAHADVCTGV